jgi:protein-S-isoprenylcysteine O-methyltransferase Ste14
MSANPQSGTGTLGRVWFGRVAVAFESWFFSFLFLSFAAAGVSHMFRPLAEPVLGQTTPWAVGGLLGDLFRARQVAPDESLLHALVLIGTTAARPVLLVFFNAMCAAFILMKTRVRYAPTAMREIVIPLLGTFLMTLLPLSTRAGRWGEPFAFPDQLMLPLLVLGTVLSLCGAAFSVYALMYLKRNFSIFVEVREVVLEGPYRHVRHPMYVGEITMMLGVVLAGLSPYGVALLGCFIALQVSRARMEQQRLAEASPEYRAHLRRSGMFVPRTR